jgi:hypothetical protein
MEEYCVTSSARAWGPSLRTPLACPLRQNQSCPRPCLGSRKAEEAAATPSSGLLDFREVGRQRWGRNGGRRKRGAVTVWLGHSVSPRELMLTRVHLICSNDSARVVQRPAATRKEDHVGHDRSDHVAHLQGTRRPARRSILFDDDDGSFFPSLDIVAGIVAAVMTLGCIAMAAFAVSVTDGGDRRCGHRRGAPPVSLFDASSHASALGKSAWRLRWDGMELRKLR